MAIQYLNIAHSTAKKKKKHEKIILHIKNVPHKQGKI